jgi:uncharacterized membrane protein YhaH (DUF805 family)
MDVFSFRGVSSRLIYIMITIVTGMLYYFGSLLTQHPASDVTVMALLCGVTFLILSLWLSVAASVRRLHDRNHSGWWALLGFVPIVNIFLFIYLLFWPSVVFGNKYVRTYYDGDSKRSSATFG